MKSGLSNALLASAIMQSMAMMPVATAQPVGFGYGQEKLPATKGASKRRKDRKAKKKAKKKQRK